MTTSLVPLAPMSHIVPAKTCMQDSPTWNPCMVRVTHNRHRNDPYKAQVLEELEYATPPRGTGAPPAAGGKVTAPVRPITTLLAPLPPVQQRSTAAPPVRDTSVARRGGPAHWLRRNSLVVDSPFTGEVFATTQNNEHAAPNESPDVYYSVKLKLYSKLYRCAAHSRFALGDVVMVEGDRGEHIGVVEAMHDTLPEGANVDGEVLRVAAEPELAHLESLREQEVEAIALVRRLATTTCPRMVVRDAEYQFDGKKITIQFESKGPCDFRNLQRALYHRFHCRIWFVSDFSKVL